jgi:hypothetical protein
MKSTQRPDSSAVPDFGVVLRFLRKNDKVGGYLPLLAMPSASVETWARFWMDVRTLDWESERTGAVDGCRLLGGKITAHADIARELLDMSRWPAVEQELYGNHEPASLADYARLLYNRAFCPVYICANLALPGEQRNHLETFAMYVGYGAQIMDDTLDILADLLMSRIFVTKEEFDLLGIRPSELGETSNLARVTAFRNLWSLYFYLQAYRCTDVFRPYNRMLARSWIEFGLRALLDGRIRPLPRRILDNPRRYCAHFGAYMILLDFPAGSERRRYRALRGLVGRVVLANRLLDISDARARLGHYDGSLPSAFLFDHVHGRHVAALDRLPDQSRFACLPDERPLRNFVHYGWVGLVPTFADLAALLLSGAPPGQTLTKGT